MKIIIVILAIVMFFVLCMYILAKIEARIDHNKLLDNLERMDKNKKTYPRTGGLHSDYKYNKNEQNRT